MDYAPGDKAKVRRSVDPDNIGRVEQDVTVVTDAIRGFNGFRLYVVEFTDGTRGTCDNNEIGEKGA